MKCPKCGRELYEAALPKVAGKYIHRYVLSAAVHSPECDYSGEDNEQEPRKVDHA